MKSNLGNNLNQANLAITFLVLEQRSINSSFDIFGS